MTNPVPKLRYLINLLLTPGMDFKSINLEYDSLFDTLWKYFEKSIINIWVKLLTLILLKMMIIILSIKGIQYEFG